jgi:hypothetical protein
MEMEREHAERRERRPGDLRGETELDDTGTKDFWFGVIGIGAIALIAIGFAIFSNI